MQESYDLIVVGAGPAGLTAAREAAKNDLDVLLLELKAQIGQTQTSSWITKSFDEEIEESRKSKVEKLEMNSTHKKIEINGDLGQIIDREIFEKELAAEAASEGVEIWLGSPVRDLVVKRGKVTGVEIKSGEWTEEVHSKAVIDATGSGTDWSSLFLRKILDESWEKEMKNHANEYLMAETPETNKVSLYFNPLLAPRGFAWVHPFGKKFSMTGIRGVRIHPDSALDEFIGRMDPDILKNSVPVGEFRKKISIDGILNEMTDDGIIAIGAAAGQIYPLSGHGLNYALKSGKLAGEVISDAVDEGNFSKEFLSDYERTWRDEFGDDIKIGELLLEALEVAPDQKMDSLLDYLQDHEDLSENFVNIFLAENLKKSVKLFFKEKEVKRIFGEERIRKVLSLCS